MKNLFAALVAAILSCTGANATPTSPFDVMFLMDVSGSLGEVAWTQERALVSLAITDYVMPREGGNRVAVTEFSRTARTIFGFNDPEAEDAEAAVSAVSNLPYDAGSTATRSAIRNAIAAFDSRTNPAPNSVLYLLTDGPPYPLRTQYPCDLADDLRERNITVNVIGAGYLWNPYGLACLVEDPETQVFQIADFADTVALDAFAQVATVPLPAGLPMLMAALGTFAVLRRRRARVA